MTLSGMWAGDVGGGEIRRFRLLAAVLDEVAVKGAHRWQKAMKSGQIP